ncbi:zinc knuckle domain containing protein [Babesia caballi]|uniref:Zinc knuckle domain containing protein n=1 Tax=Babesia caballi TaxID=5871 RepID=A0AAV4LVG6_BABCB|nr:zinc knuckle domain containing protein [Babesia caballi]
MSSASYRGRGGKRTGNRAAEGSLYADVAKGEFKTQCTTGGAVVVSAVVNGAESEQPAKPARKQQTPQQQPSAENDPSKQSSKKHRVLTEQELASFRTSFCTNHHQNKCPNSDSCEKSHCLTWQRRNPYEISYCPQLCPEIQFVKKSRKMVLYRRCTRGKNCNFAHSKEEELYHPLVYKTKQCSAHPKCSRYFCPFVHAPSEMRDVNELKAAGLVLPGSSQTATDKEAQPSSPSVGSDAAEAGRYDGSVAEAGKTEEDVSSGLWYEPPSLSAICGYDDVTFKNLYGYGCSGFAQVPTDEYAADFDLQNCVAWQTLSPGNHFDAPLMDQFIDPSRYGGDGDFDQLGGVQQFSDGLGGQLVHFVGADLEDQLGALSLRKGPEDPMENYPLNDILVNFMNDLGDNKYNRTLAGCWDRDQIEASIASRQAELDDAAPKSAARIRFLKRKISKLKRALEDGTPVGGNVLPQKLVKASAQVSKHKAPASTRRGEASKPAKRVKKICFKCRKRGHTLQQCDSEVAGICFRCGSTDHILRDCAEPDQGTLPFTSCFVCQKAGHIASQCPENYKGVYPNGGACFFCGSVTHRKVDCPERKKKPSK